MGLHHFFVEPEAIGDGEVTLSGAEGHHAARVLRVRVGEQVTVADGTGRVVSAVVTDVTDDVRADIIDDRRVGTDRPAISLFQALTKSDKLDEVIEKATEVGVVRIVPFMADRSIVRWDDSKRTRSRQRWSAIARAAAKQSRSAFIPEVMDLAGDVGAVLADDGPKVVLHEGAQERLREALPAEAPERLSLLVGPEGGLSDEEVGLLRDAGAKVVSLGPRVMRTQTAGPVAAALVAFAYGAVG